MSTSNLLNSKNINPPKPLQKTIGYTSSLFSKNIPIPLNTNKPNNTNFTSVPTKINPQKIINYRVNTKSAISLKNQNNKPVGFNSQFPSKLATIDNENSEYNDSMMKESEAGNSILNTSELRGTVGTSNMELKTERTEKTEKIKMDKLNIPSQCWCNYSY